ncbi:MAG: histidine kinase dimerization/phospho-acceptor domain-containing protein [Acidobacteriota bacterium]
MSHPEQEQANGSARSALADDAGFLLLGRVVRILLHDLSNPLAGARLMLEVLRRDSLRIDPDELGEDMRRNFHQITGILGSLRRLTQAQGPRRLDVPPLIREAADLLGSELQRRDVTLEVQLGAPSSWTALAGRQELLMVLLGGLLTTVDRTPDGGRLLLCAGDAPPAHWRLELWVRGGELQGDSAIPFDAVARWAEDLGGRMAAGTGDGPQWALDLPVAPEPAKGTDGGDC